MWNIQNCYVTVRKKTADCFQQRYQYNDFFLEKGKQTSTKCHRNKLYMPFFICLTFNQFVVRFEKLLSSSSDHFHVLSSPCKKYLDKILNRKKPPQKHIEIRRKISRASTNRKIKLVLLQYRLQRGSAVYNKFSLSAECDIAVTWAYAHIYENCFLFPSIRGSLTRELCFCLAQFTIYILSPPCIDLMFVGYVHRIFFVNKFINSSRHLRCASIVRCGCLKSNRI